MSRALTIVMYHYVRDLEASAFPRIRGLRTSEFRYQLDYLTRQYTPVSMPDVIHCIRTGEALPEGAVLLTFDDGYKDHYSECLPLLLDAGVQGAFFPPASPILDKELLDVNRIHFILAATGTENLAREIEAAVSERRADFELAEISAYRAKWAIPNPFDDPETFYVKRMLQAALPESLRSQIARDLFATYVSSDEASFASELYCSEEELTELQDAGMYVGSHTTSHYLMTSIDEATRREEIESSLRFLRGLGSPVDDYWVMCYPYGKWDKGLVSLLRSYGCAAGLTIEAATADLDASDPLLLPRYDTNDFPKRATSMVLR